MTVAKKRGAPEGSRLAKRGVLGLGERLMRARVGDVLMERAINADEVTRLKTFAMSYGSRLDKLGLYVRTQSAQYVTAADTCGRLVIFSFEASQGPRA